MDHIAFCDWLTADGLFVLYAFKFMNRRVRMHMVRCVTVTRNTVAVTGSVSLTQARICTSGCVQN